MLLLLHKTQSTLKLTEAILKAGVPICPSRREPNHSFPSSWGQISPCCCYPRSHCSSRDPWNAALSLASPVSWDYLPKHPLSCKEPLCQGRESIGESLVNSTIQVPPSCLPKTCKSPKAAPKAASDAVHLAFPCMFLVQKERFIA